MEISRKWRFSCLFLLGLVLLATTLQSVQGEDESEAPSQCKPYIEKALKEQQRDESPDVDSDQEAGDDSVEGGEDDSETADSVEDGQKETENTEGTEGTDQPEVSVESKEEHSQPDEDGDNTQEESVEEQSDAPREGEESESRQSEETEGERDKTQTSTENTEENKTESVESVENVDEAEEEIIVEEIGIEKSNEAKESAETAETDDTAESQEAEHGKESTESVEENSASTETQEDLDAKSTEGQTSAASREDDSLEKGVFEESADTGAESVEANAESEDSGTESIEEVGAELSKEIEQTSTETHEGEGGGIQSEETEEIPNVSHDGVSSETNKGDDVNEVKETINEELLKKDVEDTSFESNEGIQGEGESESKEDVPEEDLIQEIEIPEKLRPREHIEQLLKLDESHTREEAALEKISDLTLKELKKLYETAIKPLETLYKYRDLSNRHFGDSEIFSKPLVVFMGPWSGGKSTLINYLLDNEYNATSLKSGAEPSPAYFNILMYGEEPEVLDGTQLAADFTFAGLQKFGQGLEERLRGLKLPNKLLEKINIVEIPGILEVRKQVSRVFPFNDACQWFIDRADIIFLVYDPSKLDVGPETEAILDQLKGREHQTRIVLNKADQVQPEELMRVQSALIWNISPLMSSAQPPVMYTTSLWSRPYESWAPVRLLHAQERAFLRDLRSAIDKRIDNKISSARRFAVRVRNHAKMVDCYLTTYYNHKSVFGNRKLVSDQIIDHPQDYHIYEGLSTLTNISRYDLPDPDVYRDFFRLNPLYDFQQLSATCTYFRGCPINRLDVAIAYDFPELVGKHKKLVESALAEIKAEKS